MGNVNQYSSPITGFAIRADRTPVLEFVQYLQCLMDDIIGFFSLKAADESRTAVIVLKFWKI